VWVLSLLRRILRLVGVGLALSAVLLAGLYVFLASPPGTWLIARGIEQQVRWQTDADVRIGSFRTDFFSYVRLNHAELTLPNDSLSVDCGQILVRYSLLDLLHGKSAPIDRVEIRNLDISFTPSSDAATDTISEQITITPYIRFVPERIDIDAMAIRLSTGDDTNTHRVVAGLFTSHVTPLDTSLNVGIALRGIIDGGSVIGEVPISAKTELVLHGSSVRLDKLQLMGPDLSANASGIAHDLNGGPYEVIFNLDTDLSGLPSAVSGIGLNGIINADGSVVWSDTPQIDVNVAAEQVRMPWITVRSFDMTAISDETGSVSVSGSGAAIGGEIKFSATVPLTGVERNFSGTIQIDSLDAAMLAIIPGIPKEIAETHPSGRLSLRSDMSGTLDPSDVSIVPVTTASLEMRVDRLDISDIEVGQVVFFANLAHDSIDVSAEAMGASFEAAGSIPSMDSVSISAELRAAKLAYPLTSLGIADMDGDLYLRVDATGELMLPALKIRAELSRPQLPGVRIGDLELSANIDSFDVLTANLISADSVINGSVSLSEHLTHIDSLDIAIGPWPIENLSSDLYDAYGLSGAVTVHARGGGTIASPQVRANIETTELVLGREPLGAFTINADYADKIFDFEAWNDDQTLEVLGTVTPDTVFPSQVRLFWHDFRLGAILATMMSQNIGRVAGISDGNITITWGKPFVKTVIVEAQVDEVKIRFLRTTYELTNPPARFSYKAGELTIPEIELEGDNQTLTVRGAMTRDEDIDFSIGMDRTSVATLAGLGAGEDIGVSGTIAWHVDVGGTVNRPTATGFIRAEHVRWQSFAIDSIGAHLELKSDRFSIPDLHARFPFGRIDGSFAASIASLGIPIPSKIPPTFSLDMTLEDVGADIRHWDGLRGGRISMDGAIELMGAELADLRGYRGTISLDSLDIQAPFSRSVVLGEPFILHVSDADTAISGPIQLIQKTGSDAVGTVSVGPSTDETIPGLEVQVRHLDLDHLRHVAMPLSNMLDISLPDDLGGSLNVRANWNGSQDDLRTDLAVSVVNPMFYGISLDSIRAHVATADGVVRITDTRIHSAKDRVDISGEIDLEADTLRINAVTEHFEAVRIAQDVLPPIDQVVPPAPWPTTVPLPGASQHVQFLPKDMSGRNIAQALSAYDRLAARNLIGPDNNLAAALPVRLKAAYSGPSSNPLLTGRLELLGGYFDLEALEEPLWFTDTLRVDLLGRHVKMRPCQVYVGAEDQYISLNQVDYSLDDKTFDIALSMNKVTATVISVERLALPWYAQWAGVVVQPLIDAYNTDPVGTFAVSAEMDWHGTADESLLRGDVQLHKSIFQYPVPKPQEMLAMAYGGSGSASSVMPGVDMELSIVTVDSLVVENNVSDGATVGFRLDLTGFDTFPKIQGRSVISPGSSIRYLGREFIVKRAWVDFRDPEVFTPEVEIEAQASFTGGPQNDTEYRVDIDVTGAVPDRVKTEMTAWEGTGASATPIVAQQDVITILLFGLTSSELQEQLGSQASGQIGGFLNSRTYATMSSALGSVLPLDRVTIQQNETESEDEAGGGLVSGAEVEVAEDFRLLGQKIRVTVGAPVGQISTLSAERAELRWFILERPELWENLESLSVTAGMQPYVGDGTSPVTENENAFDVQLRIRF
jgi:hypothetical protein